MDTQVASANKPRVTPKDFFLHLLAIVTLYISAVSLGTVLFQVVNIFLPDPLEVAQPYMLSSAKDMLRNALSFVIVAFPIYLFTTSHLNKIYAKNTEKLRLWIRKWLLYFTLFATAIVMMSSLISLVNHLLNGELTLRFILKFLIVVLISAAVFYFYWIDLKKNKTDDD